VRSLLKVKFPFYLERRLINVQLDGLASAR
jgi:hypothetical protein